MWPSELAISNRCNSTGSFIRVPSRLSLTSSLQAGNRTFSNKLRSPISIALDWNSGPTQQSNSNRQTKSDKMSFRATIEKIDADYFIPRPADEPDLDSFHAASRF